MLSTIGNLFKKNVELIVKLETLKQYADLGFDTKSFSKKNKSSQTIISFINGVTKCLGKVEETINNYYKSKNGTEKVRNHILEMVIINNIFNNKECVAKDVSAISFSLFSKKYNKKSCKGINILLKQEVIKI